MARAGIVFEEQRVSVEERGHANPILALVGHPSLQSRALPRRIQKVGLRWAIFGSFTVALVLILGTLFFVVPFQVRAYLVYTLAARGRAVARGIMQRASFSPRAY